MVRRQRRSRQRLAHKTRTEHNIRMVRRAPQIVLRSLMDQPLAPTVALTVPTHVLFTTMAIKHGRLATMVAQQFAFQTIKYSETAIAPHAILS